LQNCFCTASNKYALINGVLYNSPHPYLNVSALLNNLHKKSVKCEQMVKVLARLLVHSASNSNAETVLAPPLKGKLRPRPPTFTLMKVTCQNPAQPAPGAEPEPSWWVGPGPFLAHRSSNTTSRTPSLQVTAPTCLQRLQEHELALLVMDGEAGEEPFLGLPLGRPLGEDLA
jgi:hypothetical protein